MTHQVAHKFSANFSLKDPSLALLTILMALQGAVQCERHIKALLSRLIQLLAVAVDSAL